MTCLMGPENLGQPAATSPLFRHSRRSPAGVGRSPAAEEAPCENGRASMLWLRETEGRRVQEKPRQQSALGGMETDMMQNR